MRENKIRAFLWTCPVLFSGYAGSTQAEDYVPPPSGPYQPSVVIKDDNDYPGAKEQVYRFPSDVMFNQEKAVIPGKPLNDTVTGVVPAPQKPLSTHPGMLTETNRPSANGYNARANPWSTDSGDASFPGYYDAHPAYDYPGYWNNPQYSYPQQYPYGYNNQNNYQNNFMNPFGGMPSPWTVMPMQPFFSDR